MKETEGLRFSICGPADVEEMSELLSSAFSLYDPPAIACKITAPEFDHFLRLLVPQVLEDRLTMIARSTDSDEMLGALLTEDSASALPDLQQVSRKFDPIFDILGELETEYRAGKSPQPGECVHLFLLGVSRSSGGRGVAQQLVEACIENCKKRGYKMAVTEATNNVSQHIFRKLGFVERVSRSYENHRFEGQAHFAGIEGHAGPILMDKSF
jgi:GNAT superfamily N-acetyltransferase